jgi:protein-S-isoprenylcysteine O-methyltransferase Ste14
MQRSKAAIGSAVFFVLAPGTVVGLVPWLLTGWQFAEPAPYWVGLRVLGVVLIVAGLIPPIHAFVQFARAGGTPAPVAPTEHLVITGFNRYLRNPMYVGLTVVLVGQALLFGQLSLLIYAGIMLTVTAVFVRAYEEPTLRRQFGAEYEEYWRAVPGWWPRLRPWTKGEDQSTSGRIDRTAASTDS